MFNYFFKDHNYKQKLRSVTYLRTISFFIWKILFGLILYLLIIKLTNYQFIQQNILHGIKFHFNFIDFLKLFILSSIAVYYKSIVFQNYEEVVTKFEKTARIILDPKHATIFFFLNSVIMTLHVKILEKDANKKFFALRKSENVYEWHMIIYG
jgi:hypothetical protein